MAQMSDALDLLPQPRPGDSSPGDWSELLKLVVLGKGDKSPETLADSELSHPQQVAAARLTQISAWLEAAGRQPKPAKTLLELAKWWMEHSGLPFEDRGTETVRAELRSMPGINAELADRLLLFVGQHPAFPIDRATIRIACRHGWAEPEADYEDWQATFMRTWETTTNLQRVSLGFTEIGRKHCGPQPRCTGCPLEPLLPPGGPIALGEEGG